MSHLRPALGAGLSAALLATAFAGASEAPGRHSREQHDAYGRVTRRADGERVLYPFDPTLAAPLPAAAAPAPSRSPETPHALDITEEWRRNTYGYGMGRSGLHVADLDGDGDREILAAAGIGEHRFWYVLSHQAGAFPQTFVSDEYPGVITSLRVAQLDADPALEIVIGTGLELHVYDGATHELQWSWTSPGGVARLALADVDGDSRPEAVFCSAGFSSTTLHVHDLATGAAEFATAMPNCRDLAVGNVDDDPGLEIVVARDTDPGFVLDGATHAVEWTNSFGFGVRVRLGNLDGDARSEVVGASAWQSIRIFDVVLQSLVDTLPTSHDIGALEVIDVEGDGPLEIVYGDEQWGEIHVHDGQTLAEKWFAENPEHGITAIAFGDVDGDPAPELLWGAGYTSTGPDHLYVFDTGTHVRDWESLDLVGPFYALSHGDVDGDGEPEILYGSFQSDSGYGDGLWFVHDAVTKALEYQSPEPTGVNWTGLLRIRNANVDADPQQEIFVTTSITYEGILICYDGLTHVEQWRAQLPSGLSFMSVQVGNVDSDPGLEVVASVDVQHTGAPGAYVYVYDAGTGALEWQSPSFSAGFIAVPYLRLGNVDLDPNTEIVFAAEGGALYVIDGVTHVFNNLGDHDVTALELADRNGDGRAEMIVGTEGGQIHVVDTGGSVVEPIATYPEEINGLRVLDLTGDGAADYVLGMDNAVLIRDGITGAEQWNSGRLRHEVSPPQVGTLDSLDVADIDLDGRLEILVNIGTLGLRVFQAPAAGDVSLGVSDAPDPALVTDNVTYAWTVQNQTATVVTGTTLTVTLPAGASFVSSVPGAPTCVPAGSTLTCALGTLSGGTSSLVSVVMSPQGPGTLTTSGTVTAAVTDPDPANNVAAASTTVTPSVQADLALGMTDGQAIVAPGTFLNYAITLTNLGPWPVTSVTLVNTAPPQLHVLAFVPSVGTYDSFTGAWTGLSLGPGQSAILTLQAFVHLLATGTIVNSAVVSPPPGVTDLVPGNNVATDTDLVRVGFAELVHGTSITGPVQWGGGDRYFRIGQQAGASYEVVLDAVSGDLGSPLAPIRLQRLAGDLSLIAESTAVGVGMSRSLRWQAGGASDELIAVRSNSCTTDCGADDVFRIRAWDTTYDLSRFNNGGGQVTVLIVQNAGSSPASGTFRFWSAGGSLLASASFASLAPRGAYTLITPNIAALVGQSGSITVSNDAPYGTLTGKAVSVDLANGFSFDTPLRTRPR